MSRSLSLNVRVTGALSEFVSARVSDDGPFENVGEYVRDLIRRDKAQAEQDAFERLKAELQLAFNVADDAYSALDAETVIARNQSR